MEQIFGEHVRREAGSCVRDVRTQGSYQKGFGPSGGVVPEGGDIFQ